MSVVTQRATRADIQACRKINVASMPSPAEHYVPEFWTNIYNQYGDMFYVAKIEGKIVGYILCKAEVVQKVSSAIIISIAVDKDYRGKGIGESLMREAQRAMRDRGIMIAGLQVRQSNKPAILMYQKLGYTINLTVPQYYSNPEEDAFLMTLVL